MPRTSNTAKRLKNINAKHKLLAVLKPAVATVKTRNDRTGFNQKVRGKQSKGYKTSTPPRSL